MSTWRDIFAGAPRRAFANGMTLFRRDDPVRRMYLVQAGDIALERPLADGTALTLQVAGAGMILAEASLFAQTYHCTAVCRQAVMVSVLPRKTFLEALRRTPDAALGLMELTAREVQAQRARIEILRLRRVSERLDAWMDLHAEPVRGEWAQVADEIGVSPAALYRELARRRR